MCEALSALKNTEIIDAKVSLKSALDKNQVEDLENLAKAIFETMKGDI